MPYNWDAINEDPQTETRLYRLIGEMLKGRASMADLERVA